jgi:hypothetical protein
MSTSLQPSVGGRGLFLTIMAVLLAILAVSDFTKTLQQMSNPGLGIVVLGHRFTRFGANFFIGSMFGLMLAAYAYGIWNMKRWVLPIAVFYAFYVPVNLVLFWSLHDNPHPGAKFIVVYLAFALTGSIGTALCLAYRHDQLA